MDEYIACRNCTSPDCKGCNLKNLETMLKSGKFDCLMNANRCINPDANVSTVRHGRWEVEVGMNFFKERNCPVCKKRIESNFWNYCPNCGAKMDGDE